MQHADATATRRLAHMNAAMHAESLPPRRRWWRGLAVLALAGLAGGCGGGGASGDDAATVAQADIRVLMMGNSHTSTAELPQQLKALLRAGRPGRSVAVAVAPEWMFLEERSVHAPSLAQLRSQRWSAVVLQAQKYSTSGQFSYSTEGARQLVQASRGQQALPVLFPEWSRRGVEETAPIYNLHVSIAQAEPACVAPIGQAWDLARQRHPALRLHQPDGNHAAEPGAYLTALMLYATLTGDSPRGLPDLDNGVEPAVQAQLRAVAADTVQAVPPRQHCPADPPLAGGRGAG
jgi:hypothetical protein